MKNLKVGQAASEKRTFTEADLEEYTGLAGSRSRDFRNVPPPLLGALFSHLLGTRLPGRGTNYLKQRLEFRRAVSPGEEIEAFVEIIRLRPEKELVNLRTVCSNAAGEIVCEGEALVLVHDVHSL
ncbi:MAG: MaoC family dehydratase [Rudaea sp.]